MDFPQSTVVNKIMPKESFYRNLTLNSSVKDSFVSDIKRIVWKNKLSSDTLNISKGETVSEILVLQIELKVKNYNPKILETVSKNNTHNIFYILNFENETQTALFHNKLHTSKWQNNSPDIQIDGLNMDRVWENLVKNVEGGEWSDELSLDDNLALHEKQEKLQKEIEKLEKKAWSEKQPKKKFEIAEKIKQLKRELDIIQSA